jgi:hypothetical protein
MRRIIFRKDFLSKLDFWTAVPQRSLLRKKSKQFGEEAGSALIHQAIEWREEAVRSTGGHVSGQER